MQALKVRGLLIVVFGLIRLISLIVYLMIILMKLQQYCAVFEIPQMFLYRKSFNYVPCVTIRILMKTSQSIQNGICIYNKKLSFGENGMITGLKKLGIEKSQCYSLDLRIYLRIQRKLYLRYFLSHQEYPQFKGQLLRKEQQKQYMLVPKVTLSTNLGRVVLIRIKINIQNSK